MKPGQQCGCYVHNILIQRVDRRRRAGGYQHWLDNDFYMLKLHTTEIFKLKPRLSMRNKE